MIRITQSVGLGGVNLRSEVLGVQKAINKMRNRLLGEH